MWSAPEDRLALGLLDRLEEREYELLTWGFLDGGFTREEVEGAAQEVINQSSDFLEPDDLIARLQERALLIDFHLSGRHLYRTRFAEGVRLFARLRQIFRADAWSVAPQLVADFRLAMRPRRYPRRDVPPQAVRVAIQEAVAPRTLSPLETGVLQALTHRDGEPLLLSGFQVEAARNLLKAGDGKSRGTIVCAGTGTGKTIAFYLPALLHIARAMQPDTFWSQALAIYPRNELLKDQFSEAYGQARRLDALTKKHRGRKIRIGAYFGATPRTSRPWSVQASWGEPQTIGRTRFFLCPFLRCPLCEGDLGWKWEDAEAGRERLHCTRPGCKGATQEDEVLLTRQRIQAAPPDILFTTTEMLNRAMSSGWQRPIFGMDVPRERAVSFVLLDEAHTYGGVHGAQVGLLLRRWRHAAQATAHFVGLSATLSDPQNFFAQLTGLSPGRVLPVHVGDTLVEEGREYQLVLRGDPVSGTSLLSTTIQAAMLLGRVLDPNSGTSDNLFGRKTFVFTDDLDVTNRLYHNLLDAEGRSSWGAMKAGKVALATHRKTTNPLPAERLRDGQNWLLCERIGHDLASVGEASRLRVGRVSSQDTGVDNASQLVVATASLEVGYNDPLVGAVVQHKAPRDPASFLQRKGRAGRQRITRPWTIVVLSDYGRDRIAYQGYDQLFDPVLERPALPTDNRYVLRIQAAYAFMDWMAKQVAYPRGSVWDDFSRPARDNEPYKVERQRKEADVIRRLLETGQGRQSLTWYLQTALGIDADEVTALLWEPPRALMTAVLPTLWRRLKYAWRRLPLEPHEDLFDLMAQNAPLPEFVTASLFSDLSVPEVLILAPRGAPPGQEPEPPEEHWMSLTPALRSLAPGRVQRRFAVHHIADNHWIEPPSFAAGIYPLPLASLCARSGPLGSFQARVNDAVTEVACVRPFEMHLQRVPKDVLNTSNAQLEWHTQFLPPSRAEESDVPSGSFFSGLVRGATFYTHNGRNPLRVRRFAVASEANLRFSGGGEAQVRSEFTHDDGQLAGVGFEQEVDAIAFRCRFPGELLAEVKARCLPTLRVAYLRDRIESDSQLQAHANSFRLGWLSQIFLSIVLARGLVRDCPLSEAVEYYQSHDWMPSVERTLDVIFGVLNVGDDESGEGQEEGDEDAESSSNRPRPKLYAALRDLASKPDVRDRLLQLAASLWQAPDADWDEWLKQRLKATLGGALLQACYALTPQVQNGDLLLDLESGVPSPDAPHPCAEGEELLWISEDVMGGAGVVEELMRGYVEDPRRFFLLVETALGPSDFEIVDAQLAHIIALAQDEPQVQHAFAVVRGAEGNEELSHARRALMETLLAHNVLLTHPVMTSLNARLLRPGSSTATDNLLSRLLERWNAKEQELGIEIDARIFAYLAAVDDQFKTDLSNILAQIGGEDGSEAATLRRRYSLLYGLLWPRGATLRERALDSYNSYAPAPKGDASLLMALLRERKHPVSVHDSDWRVQAANRLTQDGTLQLTARDDAPALLQSAVWELLGVPVEAGFLRLYPHLARLENTLDVYSATLHLQEAIQ